MSAIPKTYPKDVILRDGTNVTLRPLAGGDGPALLAMFRQLPDSDRQYLREDVTDAKLIDRWVATIDVDKVFPLVAVDNGTLVGDATLHRSKAGASRHIGEIRICIDPGFRKKGLGTVMIRELIMAASAWGLEKVTAELVSAEEAAIAAFRNMGFSQLAVLPDFFKAANGVTSDKVILGYSLVTDWDAF